MIELGIFIVILGVVCVPAAAWAVYSIKKIWPTIFLSILACMLIVTGALSIGLGQLEHMEKYSEPETIYVCPYCGEQTTIGE